VRAEPGGFSVWPGAHERLEAAIKDERERACEASEASRKPARVFRDFRWRTPDSWSRERRVIGKAEWTGDKATPRFIVTSLTNCACGSPPWPTS
jgi:hypothetical protein